MLIEPGGEQPPTVIDYLETAPSAATSKLLFPPPTEARPAANGAAPSPTNSPLPGLAQPDERRHAWIGAPGTLAGLWLAHHDYGKLDWPLLVAPAIRLASEGVDVDTALAHSLNTALAEACDLADFQRLFRPPGGGQWQPGDRLAQPELARTLRRVAEQGPLALCSGPIAAAMVDEVCSNGGVLSIEDLAGYSARRREPLHGVYRGYDVYVPPAPSSGGLALIEALNMLEPFELRAFERWSPFTLHLTSETLWRAEADVGPFLGDPDFQATPLHLVSKQHSRRIARQIDPRRARAPNRHERPPANSRDAGGAICFCVCDSRGMAVSNSFGLGRRFGSRVVVPGAGFCLNESLGRFAVESGSGNGRRARRAAEEQGNSLAPGKRALSPATPLIVRRDGRTLLVSGSSGARASTAALFGVVVNLLEFKLDLQTAIDAPRWRPSEAGLALVFEGHSQEAYAGAVRGLQLMGYRVDKPSAPLDAIHAIRQGEHGLQGAVDPRSSATALGFSKRDPSD